MGRNTNIQWSDDTFTYAQRRNMKLFAHRLNMTLEQYLQRRALGEKVCTKCKQWRSISHYVKDSTRYDGLMATCSVCRHKPPRPKADKNATYRRWYAAVGAPAIRARSRARKRSIDPLPPIAMVYLNERFDNLCAYCRVNPIAGYDHVVAISKGGKTIPGNMVPCCASCNPSKKANDVFVWMQKRGFDPIPIIEFCAGRGAF